MYLQIRLDVTGMGERGNYIGKPWIEWVSQKFE